MNYYEEKTREKFRTTAIYSNRIYDKKVVEQIIKLNEVGNSYTRFYSKEKTLIAIGYLRIVYGDHGPYLEFLHEHIEWSQWYCKRKKIGYYNKWFAVDQSGLMLYEQIKDVKLLRNPPPGLFSFNGNRSEGYADYRIGRYYLGIYDIIYSNKRKIYGR